MVWAPRFGWDAAAWHAVFHAISAFCNAGFSTFTDSVAGFAEDPATLLTISALIVLGGIGFLVLTLGGALGAVAVAKREKALKTASAAT